VFDFRFDQNIQMPSTSNEKFGVAYDDSAEFETATNVNVTNPDTVRVTFNGTESDTTHVTRGLVYEGAVVDAHDTTVSNTFGATPITTGTGPQTTNLGSGFTDGPDLLGATFNTSVNDVVFHMDENVNPNSVTPGDFFLVNKAGQQFQFGSNATPADVTGADVTVHFAGTTLPQAVGAGIQGAPNHGYSGACDTENSASSGGYDDGEGANVPEDTPCPAPGGSNPYAHGGNDAVTAAVGTGPASTQTTIGPTSTVSSTTSTPPTTTTSTITPPSHKWATVACSKKSLKGVRKCKKSLKKRGFFGYGREKRKEGGKWEVQHRYASRKVAAHWAKLLHKAGFGGARVEDELHE